jgi:hypothetical protein
VCTASLLDPYQQQQEFAECGSLSEYSITQEGQQGQQMPTGHAMVGG